MQEIKITEKPDEMIAIAKQIMIEKSAKYPPQVLDKIFSTVKKYRPQASDAEIERIAYQTIYCYWVYGCTVDEYFYYKLDQKTHSEIKEYILAHERVLYLSHINRNEDAHILQNKYETYELLGEYYHRDIIRCKDQGDYAAFLEFVSKHPVFVAKPTDSGFGNGVHKVDVTGLKTEELKGVFDGLLLEMERNRTNFNSGKFEQSILLEELIEQAEELAAVHPASVNGIRVPTIRVNNKIHIYQPWWKIGRGGQFVTSAVYGTMDAGIDVETGIVDTPGVTEALESWEYHPDTHVKIVGFQIPKWKELLDTVTQIAEKLPTISYVGWDMVLTDRGWSIMEGNFRGDFMWQLYRKKGMKKEFEELIGWKLEKDFWWQ